MLHGFCTGEDTDTFAMVVYNTDGTIVTKLYITCDELNGYLQEGFIHPEVPIYVSFGGVIICDGDVVCNMRPNAPSKKTIEFIKLTRLLSDNNKNMFKNLTDEVNDAAGCDVDWNIVNLDMGKVVLAPKTKECCVTASRGLNTECGCNSYMVIEQKDITLVCERHGANTLRTAVSRKIKNIFFDLARR